VELDRPAIIQTADEPGTFIELALVVVVTGGAFVVEIALRGFLPDGLSPFGLRLRRRLKGSRLMQLRMLNDIGDVR